MAPTSPLPFFILALFAVTALCAASSVSVTSSRGGNNNPEAATSFIKSSCSATSYPTLCVESLSVYADTIRGSRRQLALAALSVSLSRAKSAKGFVSGLANGGGLKGKAYMAVGDCLEMMEESVDRLSKAVQEMKRFGGAKGQDLMWHVSNVETWVSAALTDDNTCMDGIDEKGVSVSGRLRSSIRGKIVNVAQVTSNALALVNRFAEKN
ncbi:hypothetical protein MLD38_008948 [Melastoma candidum]|uniref:Uncharacterized protein n=1 Tax=Melastoma candidum TaxID=119954 RepID=A0ACB9RVL7_9MYRT|nr:hypothetical protein MLD38_008948 [Melastoma candidum]